MKGLEYIPFLRDIGRHFSVNRMIKAESYKMRIDSEEGLSFIEFNYMLLQAYDFMELCRQHGCMLQMGGSDQWGNIVAGIDLVRRTLQKTVFGITFPLITTSSGIKMGKTHKGAVWLDPERTSPYDYYQFWINTDDMDVLRFLSLFTFLPMDEIKSVELLEGVQINAAKAVLAFEATIIAHGREEALKAFDAAASVFGSPDISIDLIPSSTMPRVESAAAGKTQEKFVPSSEYPRHLLEKGVPAVELFVSAGLSNSKGEARRLITQGGGYINGERLSAFNQLICLSDMREGEILLRAGKKKFHRIVPAK